MPVTHPLLGRRPVRDLPRVGLIPDRSDLCLIRGRLHEACGPARRTLALWLMARMEGPVIWITPKWNRDRLYTDGVRAWADPGRLIFVDPVRDMDVLWAMEETLRAGAVPLVVGDLPGPPGLTQVRRMHLAAETGGSHGPHLPLGMMLTPGDGGAQGVESRWHLAPDHARHPGQWRLERRRARTEPPAFWLLRRTKGAKPRTLTIKAA